MIQRASTQLVCNLVNCPKGIELFAAETPAAARRLHILLAMADVEDKDTRKAAGGALASVTQFEGAVNSILSKERGVEILLGLCEDEDEDIVHRGVVCILNIVSIDEEIGVRAQVKVKELAGAEILMAVSQDAKSPEVHELVKQTLKAVEGHP